MTRKKKRTPKGRINPLAWLCAIHGVGVIGLDDKVKLGLLLNDAIDEVRQGRAGNQAWAQIFDAINLTEALTMLRVARDNANLLAAAKQACVDILDRQRTTKTRAARASELAALFDLRAEWLRLLDDVSVKELDQAVELVDRRTRAAQAGGMGAQVRVIDAAGLPA